MTLASILALLSVAAVAMTYGALVLFGKRSDDRSAALRHTLENESANTIAERASAAIQLYGWTHLPAAQDLMDPTTPWSDDDLREALSALYQALEEADAREGRTGREGHVFGFYDSGLALLLEVLEGRRDTGRG